MTMAMALFKSLIVVALLSVNIEAQQPYQIAAVNRHNEHRAKHHSPPLVLDNNLNNHAVQCAQYYAQKRAIDHSCPHKDGAGENLMGGNGDWSGNDFATTKGTDIWYNEVQHYDYNNPVFSMKTGHFTQLVWKASKRFGFAVVTLNGYTAGVGLYSPTGNVAGRYQENVLRAKR